ncbi:hypothetical protein [Streptomyces diacarni]|nr:hypothetical protein [Streptomyces diacarni]
MEPLVPGPKLRFAHKETASCDFEPGKELDRAINQLDVEAPLLPANLGGCPTDGERLPGLGDEAYISEETDLDDGDWREREVRVYFRVKNLAVCLTHRRAALAALPPDSRKAVITFAHAVDKWVRQAPVTS